MQNPELSPVNPPFQSRLGDRLVLNLVVNAGGRSRRMGQDKALLPVPGTDEPLICMLVRRFQPMTTGRCVVVSSSKAVAEALACVAHVDVVVDRWRDAGALGGVATGLGVCEGWTIVLACDMPFADPTLVAELTPQVTPHDLAVIPVVAGRAQPFHGLWHASVVSRLTADIGSGQLSVSRALERLPVCWFDVGGEMWVRAVQNVNSPEEWRAVRANWFAP